MTAHRLSKKITNEQTFRVRWSKVRGRTCVDGLVAGQVALVAEGGLAAVALVGLVAVHLQHVLLQGLVLREA